MGKRSITDQEIRLIKAMLARGMKNRDILSISIVKIAQLIRVGSCTLRTAATGLLDLQEIALKQVFSEIYSGEKPQPNPLENQSYNHNAHVTLRKVHLLAAEAENKTINGTPYKFRILAVIDGRFITGKWMDPHSVDWEVWQCLL